MKSLRRFLTRLVNSATRRAHEERLKEEIEEHIALQTSENLRAGLSPVEARRQAMLKMLGFSVAYSLVPLGLVVAGHFFDKAVAHNFTVLALWFGAYAAGCWIAFFALSHRTGKSLPSA